jgi:hypothetical protein
VKETPMVNESMSEKPRRGVTRQVCHAFIVALMTWSTAWAALMVAALSVLAACGGSASPSPTPVQATPTPPPGAPELQIALASSDFGVGPNRLAFGLIDRQLGALRDADVQVLTFYLGGGSQQGPIQTVDATFRRWPTGPGGVYTTELFFDRAGPWGIGVAVNQAGGAPRTASATLEVKEKSATPAIGAPAPRSASKVMRDVQSLGELTSDPEPDPALYQMTVAEALDARKPLVVAFSTPAFCKTATCGPQLDVVKELKQQYEGRANFVHVEVYDNPHEMQGDLSRGRVSPTLLEWNLPSEPWTFIVDRDGLIRAKFEGFTTREELEAALAGVVGQ